MADVKGMEPHKSDSADKASVTANDITAVESNGPGYHDETAQVVDSAAEKALCRKFDVRLLPVLALMVGFFPSHDTKFNALIPGPPP
jgi:hypothetical protein